MWPLITHHRFDYPVYAEGDETLKVELERNAKIEANNIIVSRVHELQAFLTINQLTGMSLSEWLGSNPWRVAHGFEDSIKQALLYEVEQILQARDRKHREVEQKHKLEQLGSTPPISLPHQMGGISNYLK